MIITIKVIKMKIGKIDWLREYLLNNDYNGDYYIGVAIIDNKMYKGLYVDDFFTKSDKERFLNEFNDLKILETDTRDIHNKVQDFDGKWYKEYDRTIIEGLSKTNYGNTNIFIIENKELEKDFVKTENFNI